MNYAVILAGGKGIRFGSGNVPKQFVELTGMPMLVYSMKTAEENPNIHEICVVALEEYIPQIREWAGSYGITKLKYIAKSGKQRHMRPACRQLGHGYDYDFRMPAAFPRNHRQAL